MEVTCFMQGEFYVWFGWGGTLLEWSPASYKAHEARVERIWLHQALRPSRYFLVELWIALACARVLPCIYLSDDRFRLVSRTCHNTRWKKEDLKSFGLIADSLQYLRDGQNVFLRTKRREVACCGPGLFKVSTKRIPCNAYYIHIISTQMTCILLPCPYTIFKPHKREIYCGIQCDTDWFINSEALPARWGEPPGVVSSGWPWNSPCLQVKTNRGRIGFSPRDVRWKGSALTPILHLRHTLTAFGRHISLLTCLNTKVLRLFCRYFIATSRVCRAGSMKLPECRFVAPHYGVRIALRNGHIPTQGNVGQLRRRLQPEAHGGFTTWNSVAMSAYFPPNSLIPSQWFVMKMTAAASEADILFNLFHFHIALAFKPCKQA